VREPSSLCCRSRCAFPPPPPERWGHAADRMRCTRASAHHHRSVVLAHACIPWQATPGKSPLAPRPDWSQCAAGPGLSSPAQAYGSAVARATPTTRRAHRPGALQANPKAQASTPDSEPLWQPLQAQAGRRLKLVSDRLAPRGPPVPDHQCAEAHKGHLHTQKARPPFTSSGAGASPVPLSHNFLVLATRYLTTLSCGRSYRPEKR